MLYNIILTKDVSKIIKTILYLYPTPVRNAATLSAIKTVDLAYSIYENSGKTSTKPPFVIFHGLFGSRRNWEMHSKAINQITGRKVIAIDARNHGDSKHSPEHTYFHMAYDVIELLENLELKKISLLGHSMGGFTAMVFALIRPDLVSSLAIEDVSPVVKNSTLSIIIKAFDVLTSLSIESTVSMSKAKELADEHLKLLTANICIRNYFLEEFTRTKDGLYTWRSNVPVLKKHFQSNIRNFPADKLQSYQYAGPTLFIKGSRSDFIGQNDLPGIKKFFPSAKVIILEGTGHWLHSQKPEEFIKIMCEFLTL